MRSLRAVAQMISDRRNWPAIALAGALVFLGTLVLDTIGLNSAFWVAGLIVLAALAAKPFVKG